MEVKRNANINMPVARDRFGAYKVKSGDTVGICFTSDFLLQEADKWREEIWDMICERQDVNFFFITKRIDRLMECLPYDWDVGYENVTIGCTCENQEMADYRLPIFLDIPIKSRYVICEPLLSDIHMESSLKSGKIDRVLVGGESGNDARICDYDSVLSIREQCINANVKFEFHQTGARLKKDGKVYRILRRNQHIQAKRANIDT